MMKDREKSFLTDMNRVDSLLKIESDVTIQGQQEIPLEKQEEFDLPSLSMKRVSM